MKKAKRIVTIKSCKTPAVLLMSVITLLSISAAQDPPSAHAAKPKASAAAGPKQYIYSRSARQSTSRFMGVTGVPAYIALPSGSRTGVYVTGAESSGFWRVIGLRPGSILIMLDNRRMESPSAIDSFLQSKGRGQVQYTFARVVGGEPKIFSGSSNYSGEASLPASTASVSGSSIEHPISDSTSISELESHMVKLINRDRAANGIGSVSSSSSLSNLARSYAEYMLQKGSFSHVDPDGRNPNDRAKQAGITGGVSENLSYQSRGLMPDKDMVERAQAGMMSEPPNQQNHRGTILNPALSSVGVGIARNKGTIMMVQEYQ